MTTLRDFAEIYARKRGVWQNYLSTTIGDWRLSSTSAGIQIFRLIEHDGKRSTWLGHQPLDPGTALILTHTLTTGLRLHVGRCPACVERGRGWEYRRTISARSGRTLPDTWVRVHGPLLPGRPRVWVRPCPECSEPGPEVDCEACEGKGEGPRGGPKFNHATGRDEPDTGPWAVVVPCSWCDGTGKRPGDPQPTGQRWLDPIDWVLACKIDPDIHAAATVLADRMQPAIEGGGCPDPETETWAALLAAWLVGECPQCEGGRMHQWAQATADGWKPSAPGLDGPVLPWMGTPTVRWRAVGGRACRRCPCCHGEGTVLGAMLDVVANAVGRNDRDLQQVGRA